MVLLAIAGEPVIAGPSRDDSDPVVDFSTGGMSLWLLKSSFASSGPLVGFWFWNVNVNIQEPVKSQWPSICLRLLVHHLCLWVLRTSWPLVPLPACKAQFGVPDNWAAWCCNLKCGYSVAAVVLFLPWVTSCLGKFSGSWSYFAMAGLGRTSPGWRSIAQRPVVMV